MPLRAAPALLAVILAAAHAARAAPPATQHEPWTEKSFDARVLAALKERYPKAKLEKIGEGDDLAFRVSDDAAKLDLQVSFGKPRARCREDWSDCGALVARQLEAIDAAASADKTPLAPAQLRLVLRSPAKIGAVQQAGKGATLTRPFARDAQWVLAADLPTMVRLGVRSADLKLSDEAAWARAQSNTEAAVGSPVSQVANGFLVFQGDYAPSALLFPAKLLEAARKAFPDRQGTLYAVAPEENILLYTVGQADDAGTLAEVAARGSANSAMPLSEVVMEWDGASWHKAQ